jgi:serine/threonine protein kinase
VNPQDDHDQTVTRREGDVLDIGNGRYRLEKFLGRGNLGTVWRARDLDENDTVAVKVFRRDARIDPAEEARIQRKLSGDDRIVGLRNFDARSGAQPIIAMEYIAGGSIDRRLEHGPVGVVLAKRWAHDALEALARAHAEGIVHRDVRASNLLLDRTEHAMLSDFGVSADTIRGVIADRRGYRAVAPPEVASGGPIGKATDVWAVGCLIFLLVTGEYPYEDAHAAGHGGHEPLYRRDIQVPMAFSRVVDRALAIDPAERYQDAGEMLTDLSPLRIVNNWTSVSDARAREAWETTTRQGRHYRVEIVERRSGGYTVAARTTPGSKLNRRRNEPAKTMARARKIARGWLTHVVEGTAL